MAGTCAAFDKLALRAAAAPQQTASTGWQPMQQLNGFSRLDAALHAARQETPLQLLRWWEDQLASGRAHTLHGEIEKWKKNCQDLYVTEKARDHLRKLCAVEAAVGRAELPSEIITAPGWKALRREQDLRQQQAQAEAQLAAAHLLQHTPPLQNGSNAQWLDRAVQNQREQQILGSANAAFTQHAMPPWFDKPYSSQSNAAAVPHAVPKDRRGQALAAAAAAVNSSATRNRQGGPAGRLGGLSALPRPSGSQRITHTPAPLSAAHTRPAEPSRRLRSSGLPCGTCDQYFDRANLRHSQLADDRPGDWMCRQCWQELLLPGRKWPSLEADTGMFDTASAIGRAGAAAAPSKGAKGRKKAAGSAEPADRSQQTIQGSMGKGKLQLRRTGAGLRRRDGGSGSSEEEWGPVGSKSRRGGAARRHASQRAAAAQQMPGGNAEEPVTLLSSDEDDPAQPVGRQDTTGAGGSPELDQEWPDSGSKPAPVPQPRRSERANIHRSTGDRFKGCVAVYPAGRPDGVEVRGSDLARLDDDEFLNDTVIDLYIRYIQEHLPNDVRSRCHFFNSFFFKKLTEKGPRKSGDSAGSGGASDSAYKRGFERVRKWTRGVDIFAKDWLFVPIHDHLHWSLVLVAHPGVLPGSEPDREQCIIHFDSMEGGGHSTSIVTRALRQYLQNEWERLAVEGPEECVPKQWAALNPDKAHPNYTTPKNCPGMAAPKLPKQDNHCDCGLFLLAFLEYFVYSPPNALTAEAVREGHVAGTHEYRGFMSKVWFTDRNAGALRGFLRSIILQAFAEQGKAKVEFLRAEGKDHEARLVADGVAAAAEDLREYQLHVQNGGRGYVSPAAYQPDAKVAYDKMLEVQARAAELREKRKQEAAERRAEEAATKKRVREETRARTLARSRDAPDAISLGDDRDEGARAHDSDAELLNADIPAEQRRHHSRSSGRTSASDDGEDIELVLSESPEDGLQPGSDAVVIPATDDEEPSPAQPRVRKRRKMRRSLIAESDNDSRDAVPAQQQERPKCAKRNCAVLGDMSDRGRGADGDVGASDAFDTLLADEAVAAAQPDGQQAAALDLATGLQSDDDQPTKPLPQSAAGAAASVDPAGVPEGAGGREQSPAEPAATGTSLFNLRACRLPFERNPPTPLRGSSAEGSPSNAEALDAAQAMPAGQQQQQHPEGAGSGVAAPLPFPHIADYGLDEQAAAAGTDSRQQQTQGDQEVLVDMNPLFRDSDTPTQYDVGSRPAGPSAAGHANVAVRQQHLPNAFAAYAMENGSVAAAGAGTLPGANRRRRASAPIDKRRRVLATQDDTSAPSEQVKPGLLAGGFGAIAKLASLWAGHGHQPASSDGATLQHATVQQDLHVYAASANPGSGAAGPAEAGHGSLGGHHSQPLAPPLSNLLLQPDPKSSGSLRGAKRRKTKRPAQKSGGEAAPHQWQQQQHPAGLVAPSAEEAAELQLSDEDDTAADGSRLSSRLGNGSANGLTGPWEPFPTDRGGRRTAARVTEPAAAEPIALDSSSGATSGSRPGS